MPLEFGGKSTNFIRIPRIKQLAELLSNLEMSL